MDSIIVLAEGVEGDLKQGAPSERQGGDQADLPGLAEHPGEVEATAEGMACCQDAARYPVWRQVRCGSLESVERLTHRISYRPA
jgi:hypothetical protein